MERQTKELTTDHSRLRAGISKIAQTVGSTMGAKGRTVLIADGVDVRATKDGVSVVKSIHHKDDIEGIGGTVVVNAAQKTVDAVGDGTTATTVLVDAFLDAFSDSRTVKEDLINADRMVEAMIQNLRKTAVPITKVDQIRSIANISSNSERLGKLLGDVYEQVGMEAAVHLEIDHDAEETHTEVLSACTFSGTGVMVHSSFANQLNGNFSAKEARVVVLNKNYTDLQLHKAIMEMAQDEPVVVIARNFSQQASRAAVAHKKDNSANLCFANLPGYANSINENCFDILSLLRDIEYSEEHEFTSGLVDQIVVTPSEIRIYNENKTAIYDKRLRELIGKASNAEDDFFASRYQQRYDNLAGKNAVIWAAGPTAMSAKEEYDRIEDAIGSIKASIRGGFVAGGGAALLRSSELLKYDNNIYPNSTFKKLSTVVEKPFRTILTNAGVKRRTINKYIKHLRNSSMSDGYNVHTDSIENLVADGIIDPVDVVIEALKNAYDTAKMVINTKWIVQNDVNVFNFGK